MIKTERQEGIEIVRLDNGVTNALSLDVVHALAETLERLRSDPDCLGIVLASTNDKFFSIGFDLPNLYELSREDFEHFYRKFNRMCLALYTIPKPTVIAITGHAIAGGCILAICCDYRFIAEGRKLMGLNEIKLGVPMPFLADGILRSLVGMRTARDIVETGEFFPAKEALDMGLVDQVLPIEQVFPAAVEKARAIGTSPQNAFAVIKRYRVEPIAAEAFIHTDEKTKDFLDCWFSDEARKRLKDAIEKF